MADYKDIVGTAVRNNAGNLSSDQQNQIFYDSTNIDFKYQIEAVADSWRTVAPLNSARASGVMGGTKTSSWVAGGEMPTSTYPSSFAVYMELWNGSTWTEVNDLTTPKTWSGSSRGVPNNTTGLVFAGYGPPSPTGPAGGAGYRARTEEWNGSNWTEVGDVNTARGFVGGAGTSAEACLCFGGWNPPSAYALTELWNGSSWTETTDLNVARYGNPSFGSSTSALYMGSAPSSPSTHRTESWNGSTWTEVADMTNTDKNSAAGVNNTAGLAFGGMPEGHTERWNGSTWTETADFNTARYGTQGAGASSTSGIVAGGSTPSSPNNMADVEEFSGSAPIGAWSTGGSLNEARYEISGTGLQTAALAYGGSTSPPGRSTKTESYDGTSWTEVNDLNTARGSAASAGTYTSALMAGGEPPSGQSADSESWNGSNWTETNNLNTARRLNAGAGASNTAALVFGGYTGTAFSGVTENWDGSSWTEVNDLNQTRSTFSSGTGTNTAALCISGFIDPPNGSTTKVEQWNGSSWTEISDVNTARSHAAANGTTTSALIYGGSTPAISPNYITRTEDWNGASWVEVADLSTGRSGGGGAGADVDSGLYFGGSDGSTYQTATEEWSGSSTTTKVLTD